MKRSSLISCFLILAFFLSNLSLSFAEDAGVTLSGTVTIGEGSPIHNVSVTILQLRLTVTTDSDGKYVFKNVPPGNYDVVAHLDRVPDAVKTVQLTANSKETLDFELKLTGVKEQMTVTASGSDESSFNSIQSVSSLGSLEIIQKNPSSLGEVLDHEIGVAKRSSGPGNSRPVLRGFDGDRVLVLQDGERSGSLGAQSGDHSEPIDVMTVEKLEVVKGPATLLYGSNAIGGVVNAVSRHDEAHQGVRGYLSGLLGSNREQFGGSGGIEIGTTNWLFWGNGSGERTSDYKAGKGILVPNSFTRSESGSGGFGYYQDKVFFSVNYGFNKSRYGIPFDPKEENPEIVFLNPQKQAITFTGGFRDFNSFIASGKFNLHYVDYKHSEIDSVNNVVDTAFKNKTFTYEGMFDEKQMGKFSGTLGFWGLHRDFQSSGEEAIAPNTKQNGFAVFGLQKINFERVQFQFGGRVEHSSYNPDAFQGIALRDRNFTGFSGAAGVRVPTWTGGAFVVNYSHSYRAPSLDELYNHGPHAGNRVFEVGDENLIRESGDGIEVGVRHSTNRLHAELNYYYYHIRDFVFLAPTGVIDEASGLPVEEYQQGTSRYTGVEGQFDVQLHPQIRLLTGVDYVNAELTDTNTPLPRIPPLRGRVGVQFTYKGLVVTPEAILSKDQNRLFPLETRTPGYGIFNISSSYTLTTQHIAHVFSLNGFNLGDKLYFNHLSFIKEIAPEIGRGVRFTYTMRFF